MNNSSKNYQSIQLCINAYEAEFQDDWIEKLDWSSEDSAKNSVKHGQEKILQFQRVCFIYIAKSLLGGEYIPSINSHKYAHKRFERYWTQEHYCPILDEDKYALELKRKLYTQYELLDNYIKDIFLEYASFIISIDERIEPINHKYIFRATTTSSAYSGDNRYFRILKWIIFPLCHAEHHLSFSKDNLEEIVTLRELLKYEAKKETDEQCLQIFKLFSYKASFILKKLLHKGEYFDISIDAQKSRITRESLSPLPQSIETFFVYFENIHEGVCHSEATVADNEQATANGKGVLFMQFAHLMNFYCNNGTSEQQIKNLLDKFEQRYTNFYDKQIKHTFDKYALCTLRNFMYNCRLSYLLRNKKCSIDTLCNELEAIENIQEETSIRNFYPYKKAIEFLIKIAKDKISERDISFDYDKIVQLLDTYLEVFDKNVEWCQNHCFYPVQLLLKECLIEIEGYKIFLPSSISRPVDYGKLMKERESYRSDIDFIRNSIVYIKDKQDTESIKNELKNIEKRYLEIGGVLIGVVTFLFGSINIFSQQTATPKQLFYSTLGLGLILIIFALVLVVVIEHWKGLRNTIRTVICSILLFVYTAILVAMAFQNIFPNNSVDNSLNHTDNSTMTLEMSPQTNK